MAHAFITLLINFTELLKDGLDEICTLFCTLQSGMHFWNVIYFHADLQFFKLQHELK